MTKDQWLRACGQRFIDRSDCDQGEAAAYAKECADLEQQEHGNDVRKWVDPATAADHEMSYWDSDDGEGEE